MQFIHAADAHIDSPLRGLELYPGAPVEQIRGATRDAFANLVQLAIERQVAFVVLAGDLFDGSWPDMQTGIWTANQFRRLRAEEIPVYLLRGNHDALSEVQRAMQWPDNVFEFSCERPQTFLLDSAPVALHGQGFMRRDVTDDLSSDYPPAVEDRFNVGVLHTSLTGDPAHDPYAPTSIARLRQLGYQYWALGHIHQRSDPPLWQDPPILFSGNLQGRHIRESGPKGCVLVQVDQQRVTRLEFLPTDTVRWTSLTVSVESDDHLPELLERVQQACITCREQAEGRLAVVRLRVDGACRAHAELQRPAGRDSAMAEIRNRSQDIGNLWIEKIELQIRPTLDLHDLRQGQDLLADLLRHMHDAGASDPSDHDAWRELATLTDKYPLQLSEAGIDLTDPTARKEWLRQAEYHLAGNLLSDDLTEQPE